MKDMDNFMLYSSNSLGMIQHLNTMAFNTEYDFSDGKFNWRVGSIIQGIKINKLVLMKVI